MFVDCKISSHKDVIEYGNSNGPPPKDWIKIYINLKDMKNSKPFWTLKILKNINDNQKIKNDLKKLWIIIIT